jgi:hypothetical protein
MAGVLVGLNRAPQNLFSLTLPNEDIIGELNHYPDPIVAQYSIWAIYENPALGLKNLRLRLHDVESRPPNIRRHVYQLVARDAQTAQDNYDFLVMGSEDPSTEARAGLATGLREIYFDSLETLILDWYSDEEADAVRQRLLEHMAMNADCCSSYKGPVLRAYEAAGSNSTSRARLESAARNTSLHLDMKKIVYDAEGRDLFSHPPPPLSGAQMSLTQRADLAKILVVTALPKEQAAVLATLDHYETVGRKNDSNVYQLGTYRRGEDRQGAHALPLSRGRKSQSGECLIHADDPQFYILYPRPRRGFGLHHQEAGCRR